MADPTIIGSGKQHSVSLPEGGSVATHRRAPSPGSTWPEQDEASLPDSDLPLQVGSLQPGVARRSTEPTMPAARVTPAPGAPLPGRKTPAFLDPTLMARIASLARHNDTVRGILDGLPAEGASPP